MSLEDFIKANEMSAKIVPRPLDRNLIKCRLFFYGGELVLVVAAKESVLDFEKISGVVGGLRPCTEAEAEEVSGYRAEFMPPVSIYGARVLVDEKVMGQRLVRCRISEEKTLEIPTGEIKDFNDDVLVVDITK